MSQQWYRHMPLLRAVRRESQRFLRFVLRWYFFFLSGVFLGLTYENGMSAIHGKDGSRSLLGQMLTVLILPVFAAVFGMAWWTILREKDSAKRWVTAACLVNLAMSIAVPLRFYYLWGASACWQMVYIFSLPAAIGVAGLAFFSPPEKQPQTSTKAHQNSIRARMALAGIFGLTSLGGLGFALYTVYKHHAALPTRMQIGLAFYLALGFVFGAAWWTISREKPTADAWGIAASFIYALTFLIETIASQPPDLAHNIARNGDWLFKNVGGLVVGILGLVVFSHNSRACYEL
jgi:hypothetical protein